MAQPSPPAALVGDAMHRGVIDAAPQTPVAEVAALMSASRVHCVVVEGLVRRGDQGEELVWGIVSDLDLMKAAAAGLMGSSAGEIAATEILTVEEDDDLAVAARMMAEHECTHLIVVSRRMGEPVGVISSLDVARVLAGSREPAP